MTRENLNPHFTFPSKNGYDIRFHCVSHNLPASFTAQIDSILHIPNVISRHYRVSNINKIFDTLSHCSGVGC